VKLIRNFVAVGVLFASGAFAANLLTNGSFEGGAFIAPGGTGYNCAGQQLPIGSTTMTGWTVTTAAALWVSNTNCDGGIAAQDGSQFVDLTGYNDTTPFAGLSQTLSTLPVGNYALTFYLGYYGTGATGGPVSVKVSAGNQSNVLFTSGSGGTTNVWTLETLNFSVATVGTTISVLGNGGTKYIGVDNFDLEQAGSGVPEPAMSIPLALAGVLFVLGRRKRARA
jgi:hypothetical protein